jgi:hypothetical protein
VINNDLTRNNKAFIILFMGYLYIFINEWMPKLVKIGTTDNLERRLRESAGSGGVKTFIPCAFSCYYAIESDKNEELEDFIHQIYGKYRINDKREFFELSAEEAKRALQGLIKLGIASEINNEETLNLSEKVNKELADAGEQIILRKRPRTTFKMLGIPIESELVYKNNHTITCKTSDEINNVEFNGLVRTISNLSDELTGSSSNGFEYFMYKGKILGDIRRELEAD